VYLNIKMASKAKSNSVPETKNTTSSSESKGKNTTSSSTETKNTTSPSSETKVVNPLDIAVNNFIGIFTEVQSILDDRKKGTPYWSICANKFHSSYLKVNDAEGFREMFQIFHKNFNSQYCIDIFGEDKDGDFEVKDDFFRDINEYTIAGKIKKNNKNGETEVKKKSFASKPALKGPVIYFSTTEEKVSGVCLPLGEIYRVCMTLYDEMEKKGEDDSEIRVLPMRLLLYFYTVIFKANGEFCTKADVLKSNIKILTQTISELSNDDTEKKESGGGPFSIIQDIMKKLTGGKNPVIPGGSEINKVVENVIGETGDLKNVFTNVMGEMQKNTEVGPDGQPPGIGAVLKGIASGLTAPETTQCFENIQTKIGALTGDGPLAPPSGNAPAASSSSSAPVSSAGAEDQE
jgi:hypothetical protein